MTSEHDQLIQDFKWKVAEIEANLAEGVEFFKQTVAMSDEVSEIVSLATWLEGSNSHRSCAMNLAVAIKMLSERM